MAVSPVSWLRKRSSSFKDGLSAMVRVRVGIETRLNWLLDVTGIKEYMQLC